MSCHTKEQLEDMLEDVVSELDMSDQGIEEHGPLGTPPAQLVRLALDQKDKIIRNLRAGMIDVNFGFGKHNRAKCERPEADDGESV